MLPDSTASRASDPSLSRRGFLAASAAVGGGLMLGLSLPLGRSQAAQSESFAPNAFIRIDPARGAGERLVGIADGLRHRTRTKRCLIEFAGDRFGGQLSMRTFVASAATSS
jgi:hypothetical protein